jgi:DNA-directed RNA polymerase
MMLTVLGCMEEGVESFGMIHDSFATHAADAPTMGRVLREAFVKMYEDDRLADFAKQIMGQVDEGLADEVDAVKKPEKGTLNLKDVLNSPYFFA